MILAFESSCDESALAIFDPSVGLRGEWIHSQMALHARHGGVVPDLATREHLRHFGPLLERARDEVGFAGISEVAVTRGPGLAACLAIGMASAKAMAWALRVRLVPVNHLRAHAWSPFIALHAAAPADFAAQLEGLLPHVGLLVSGGNTLLFRLSKGGRMEVLASTRDDAAGEALDKGAKLLGLGYPGGPEIEVRAQRGRSDAFAFPRSLERRDELDFSFSGLKTSLRYRLEKMSPQQVLSETDDLCASYQQAVIDTLARKAGLALEQTEARSLGLSGGVANNGPLRTSFERVANKAGIPFLAALPRHTGDNAGMIAFAAFLGAKVGPSTATECEEIDPGLPLA